MKKVLAMAAGLSVLGATVIAAAAQDTGGDKAVKGGTAHRMMSLRYGQSVQKGHKGGKKGHKGGKKSKKSSGGGTTQPPK